LEHKRQTIQSKSKLKELEVSIVTSKQSKKRKSPVELKLN